MAGLKSTQLSDVPVAFWTFDSDRTGLNGNQIVDEIGNGNPMIVNSDINGDNYFLERQSLNEIETADQHAMSVAINQKVGGNWLEQYFEVVHTTAFDFPDRGEFSVEWLYYKDYADDIRNSGEPGQHQNITTPLISKGSVFNASIVDSWGGGTASDRLTVSVLGRSISLAQDVYPVFGRTNHCVVTYRVNQTDVNEYESIVSFYLNGRLFGTDTETHVDTFPNTSTSASWLFCGNGGTNPVSDFATERLTLDQIAVYARGLTTQEVANHYRKTKQYDAMIKDDYPQHYWRLDELQDPLNDTIEADVGGVDGTYYGAVNRYQPGPDRIITAHAPFFQQGAAGYIDSETSSRFNVILHPNQDYTLEFWFKSNSNDRGLLFDCTEEHPDSWDGIRVFINSKGNAHSPGNIQVNEAYENHVASLDLDANGDRYLFNDNEWHHLVMRRDGNTLALFLDGLLHSEADFAKVSTSKPGQVHLMNGRPGDYAVDGGICEIAFYQRALQQQQIYNRYIFSTRYKISGFTLLQGAPVKALLRFYDTVNGQLVDELESDGITGEYIYYPMDNRHLDIVSKLPENNTTRYRVHGPVAPAEYDDSHLQ